VGHGDCPTGQHCAQGRCAPGAAPEDAATACELERIFFDFDAATIRNDARTTMEANARCLKAKGQNARLAGHADERGTSEYNYALAQRRADAARDFLKNLGIEARRLETVSYGEDRPLDAGHDESAWSKNRRVDFEPR
jgi:peptidoglycan-associated lipoprotein